MNNKVNTRTHNSKRNMMIACISQIVTLISVFIVRNYFIASFNEDYLGVNEVFLNILGILALTEIGITGAITYCLYKPVADQDYEKISAIVFFLRKINWIVFVSILTLAGIITPFITFFFKQKPNVTENLQIVFFIYAITSASSYILSHKRILLTANQNNHIVSIIHSACQILMSIIQILILMLTKSFYSYLLAKVLMTVAENVFINIYVTKKYPKVVNKYKLSKEERKGLFNYVKSFALLKVGGTVISSTDAIVMGLFVVVGSIGKYSNYNLIFTSCWGILVKTFEVLAPSIGNLGVTSDKAHIKKVFYQLNLGTSWLIGYLTIGMFCMMSSFVGLLWGSEYVLDIGIILVYCLNMYILMMRNNVSRFITELGMFKVWKYRSLIEAGLNIGISLLLGYYLGIIGVLLGTIISGVFGIICEVIILFKKFLECNIWEYFIRYLFQFALNVSLCAGLYYLTAAIPIGGILGFILNFFLISIIVNCIYLLVYFKTSSFKEICKKIFSRKKEKSEG